MSRVDTRADIPVSHSEQNKLHGADRESKHKHGAVGEISRADSRRRWNNLQQARPLGEMGKKKKREGQLQQCQQTSSPLQAEFVPQRNRGHI